MTLVDRPSRYLPIDRIYAALRAAALAAGIAYPFLARLGPAARESLLIAFAVFALYSILIYAAGSGWLRSELLKERFYTLLGAFDLVFVLVLMNLTGGGASPFYRALYLWVAMPAFYFGLRSGTIASAVAFCALVWFFDVGPKDPWVALVLASGLLLHGPLIGYLVDRDREQRQLLQHLQSRVDEMEHEQQTQS